MSFFEELKRRNIYRVGIAYLALGWFVVGLTDIVVPILNMPAWTLAVVTWLGVIGFPFALLFAWAFELTPAGLQREKHVDRSNSIAQSTGRKLDFAIIGLLAMALLVIVLDQYVLEDQPLQEPVVDQSSISPDQALSAKTPESIQRPPDEAKSIAVYLSPT